MKIPQTIVRLSSVFFWLFNNDLNKFSGIGINDHSYKFLPDQ